MIFGEKGLERFGMIVRFQERKKDGLKVVTRIKRVICLLTVSVFVLYRLKASKCDSSEKTHEPFNFGASYCGLLLDRLLEA